MRNEKEFLNTLETMLKVVDNRVKEGRAVSAHEELELLIKMTVQRKMEVEGTARWINGWANFEIRSEEGG